MREALIQELKEFMEEKTGKQVIVKEKLRNNGVKKTVMIIKEDEEVGAGVTLDEILDEILAWKVTVEEVKEVLLESYRLKKKEQKQKNAREYTKEEVLREIRCMLINREWNAELLRTSAHREFLDLAVIYVKERETETTRTNSVIRKEALKKLGISEEELEKAARENTKKAGLKIMCMEEAVKELAQTDTTELEAMGITELEEYPIYVGTRTDYQNGAAIMLYREYFEELAETLESDLMILPSSIHEVIITKWEEDIRGAKETVKTTNENEVKIEDRLSNSIYRYKRKEKRIERVG